MRCVSVPVISSREWCRGGERGFIFAAERLGGGGIGLFGWGLGVTMMGGGLEMCWRRGAGG
jgi:hypothetical protein